MNSHKATFRCPALRNHMLIAVCHVKSWRETSSGEKTNLFYRAISHQKRHMKLARIKNLKNLHIGTGRPMQTA